MTFQQPPGCHRVMEQFSLEEISGHRLIQNHAQILRLGPLPKLDQIA